MPLMSRYSDQQVEILMDQLSEVLNKSKTPTDLSLIVLGNLVSHIINTRIAVQQRQKIIDLFSQSLINSVDRES